MSNLTKRATVYLEPTIHKALRIKSFQTSLSISQLINDALRAELLEDIEDIEAFTQRVNEPTVDYQTFVQELKRDGIL
ncbi:MAG: CopG family transcriptional regulator [Candidatus Marinimicrobia bacterium]|nr:CopG family transcriptional regulator [Candidatus Neomarinimicrobiota bacterium]